MYIRLKAKWVVD